MEECEALCHRIGIMVLGQLSCLGTAQSLKSKFGEGYQLDMSVDPSLQSELIDKLTGTFGEGSLETLERHESNITFRIKEIGELSLGDMFEILENLKKEIEFESYALNQTTLEQIFIQMASKGEKKEMEKDSRPPVMEMEVVR